MKTIDEYYTALENHFKEQIKNDNFEIIEIGPHTTTISINGYGFILWTSPSTGYGYFRTYESESSAMQLRFSAKEQKEFFEKFLEIQKNSNKENRIKQLKNELEKLES